MATTVHGPASMKIKAIGLGGAGCNAVARMVREGIEGADFIAMNTDAQSLALSEVPTRIQLGELLTRGLGTGGDHDLAARATEESLDLIEDAVRDAELVFVVAGMGGGTGTGSIPIVSRVAKQSGALTIAVVTKPFSFEGTHRAGVAEEGLMNLSGEVDTLIIIPNDRLLQLCDTRTSVDDAFRLADGMLCHAVRAIVETITVSGLVNLDFADVHSVMKDAGPAWLSVGRASGRSRAAEAAKAALTNPLLNSSVDGATSVLLNITGGPSLTLRECSEAVEVIAKAVDTNANIVFAVVFDPEMNGEVRITLIATGFAKAIGLGAWSAEELRRLISGGAAPLEAPSFLRGDIPYPGSRTWAAIDRVTLARAYSAFESGSDNRERALLLKRLRDQIAETGPLDPAVELLNSLWRLSRDAGSVPDHARVMTRLLHTQSFAYETTALRIYYSFILSACDIRSASDLGRVPLEIVRAVNERQLETSDMVQIPAQVVRLSEMAESASGPSFTKCHTDWLRSSEETLRGVAASLKSEPRTPEAVCLSYVANHWLELVAGGVRMSLSSLRCRLAADKPLYVNRMNEVQITVSGGIPNQRLRIHAPVTPDYDAQLDDESSTFRGSVTNIGLRIRPHVPGPLSILIEIEGVTHQIEGLALLENPFVIGRPVLSEDMFVGRQEIVNRIIRGVVAEQPTDFLVVGRRRIGKTSLLHAIERQLPKSFLPVFISTETCGTNPREVCQALAQRIARCIAETESPQPKDEHLPVISQDGPTGSFVSWLETTRSGLPALSIDAIVLLIDEALQITEWHDSVQALLRYILSSMGWIRGVLAGPPDIIERMAEHVSSPLYNIFATLRVGPISKDDTSKLLMPLKNCGIGDAEHMLDTIYDYSGGIPYYVQAIGHELIENCFSSSLTGEQLLSTSLAQIRQRLITSYPVTLRRLPAEQKISIVLAASGVNPPEVPANRLAQADLIEKDGTQWIVRARIEREWIIEYADQLLDSAGQQLWDDHRREIDLLRLADDLKRLKKAFSASEKVSEALTSAISAAEAENGAKTLKYLGKIGQWVLETASKIGADVAVAAVKRVYGLP